MGQAREGRHLRPEPAARLRKLGGDTRFLARLPQHPALKVIERLGDEDKRKVETAAKLAELEATLDQAVEQTRALGSGIFHERSLAQSNGWQAEINEAIKSLSRVRLGLSAERYLQGGARRRGIFATHHERYFYLAFLIPYTAFLRQSRDMNPSPDWQLIEAWFCNPDRLQEEEGRRLRAWWGKEVLQRKSWPSRPLLYALAAGTAVFLETRGAGKRAAWIMERDHLGRPHSTENHPAMLKRTLNRADMDYLGCVFRYVPLVRDDLVRLYPKARTLLAGLPSSPFEAMAQKRIEDAIERLPPRLRVRLAQTRGESLDTKALFRRELAKLKAKTHRRPREKK